MLKLRAAVVMLVTFVWSGVVIAAVFNPPLVTLATVVTPVMLAGMGWLLTGGVLRFLRETGDGESRRTDG